MGHAPLRPPAWIKLQTMDRWLSAIARCQAEPQQTTHGWLSHYIDMMNGFVI
ncbi:hypothetical protein [Methylophaga sp.]|uniref:hypothetical protein n=1 Tax=Methylophaga sp. TaxID=2024840 RepID=UPI003A8EC937